MSKRPCSTRATIGVIMNEYEGVYHAQVREGIEFMARERDVNIIYLSGKALGSPYPMDPPYNVIYTLAKECFDGLIITSGSLTNFCGEKELLGIIEQYRSLPMVCISSQISGVPSIITDNNAGMGEALRHLIEVHHHRRIAFIRGPKQNSDAEQRYVTYLNTLQEYGIPVDPDLVFHGDFCFPTGALAVAEFLDRRGIMPDVIVASNDDMAHSVLVELKRRKIKTPSQIAVVGYDDIEVVRNLTPPMTSVAQPLYDQGETAVRLVLDQIRHKAVPEVTVLPSRLIIRESCGCLPHTLRRNELPIIYRDKNISPKTTLIRNFVESVTPINDHEFFTATLESLLAVLELKATEEDMTDLFLNRLNEGLHQTTDAERSVVFWQDAIAFLRRHSAMFIHRAIDTDELCYKAQVLITGAIRRQESNRRLPIYHILWSMRNFMTQSNAILNTKQLAHTLRDHLPYFGFQTCYVALYPMRPIDEKRGSLEVHDHLQLMVGIKNACDVPLDEQTVYPTKQLLPDWCFDEEQRFTWIVQPLTNREEQLGILILDLVGDESLIYPSLREQISCVVQGIEINQRQLKTELRLKQTLNELESVNQVLQEQSFRDELTGLYNRRGFLAMGKDHLKQACSNGMGYVLFFADMDELKSINDEYGHSEGDFAIKMAGDVLKHSFTGPTDMVARFGGDEFVVLAMGCPEEAIVSIIRRIASQVELMNRMIKKPYRITMSIGTAIWHAGSHVEFDTLLLEADRRLYEEKFRKKTAQSLEESPANKG